MRSARLLSVLVAALGATVLGQAPAAPVEFGRVAWQRDFAKAEATAKEKKLPLLVLFSEVPG